MLSCSPPRSSLRTAANAAAPPATPHSKRPPIHNNRRLWSPLRRPRRRLAAKLAGGAPRASTDCRAHRLAHLIAWTGSSRPEHTWHCRRNAIRIRAVAPEHIGLLTVTGKDSPVARSGRRFPCDLQVDGAPAREGESYQRSQAPVIAWHGLKISVLSRGDRFASASGLRCRRPHQLSRARLVQAMRVPCRSQVDALRSAAHPQDPHRLAHIDCPRRASPSSNSAIHAATTAGARRPSSRSSSPAQGRDSRSTTMRRLAIFTPACRPRARQRALSSSTSTALRTALRVSIYAPAAAAGTERLP